MPSGTVIHALGRATGKVPGLRRLPLAKLIAVAEIGMLAHDHLVRLSPGERRRLVTLVRTGKGRRRRLTQREYEELEGLLVKLGPRELLGDAADRLSPVPLPRRLVHGRSKTS